MQLWACLSLSPSLSLIWRENLFLFRLFLTDYARQLTLSARSLLVVLAHAKKAAEILILWLKIDEKFEFHSIHSVRL